MLKINQNKGIEKKLYSRDFWVLKTRHLICDNIGTGFRETIALTYLKNENFAGIEGFNTNKYCKEYNKVLEKDLFNQIEEYEQERFFMLPKFLQDFGYFISEKAPEYEPLFDLLARIGIPLGLSGRSGMDYNCKLSLQLKDNSVQSGGWTEFINDNSHKQISRIISKKITLLDEKYNLSSDNVGSLTVFLSAYVVSRKVAIPEIKKKIYPSNFWVLDDVGYFSNVKRTKGKTDLMVLNISKISGGSIDPKEKYNLELENFLSDAILYRVYDRSLDLTNLKYSITKIYFKNGGGLFRVIVPEDRNRDKDKNISIDFKCQISVKLKGDSTKSTLDIMGNLIVESSDWDSININNHTQISNFISKKITLLDEKYNLSSDSVESIVIYALLPRDTFNKAIIDKLHP